MRQLTWTRPVVCWALIAMGSWASAQEPASEASGEESAAIKELQVEQSRITESYKTLEQLILRMAEIEAVSNPQRASLLKRAARQSAERLTRQRLTGVNESLAPPARLQRAIDAQQLVVTDLQALLALLMSEDRSTRIKGEKERVREYIKEVNRLIRLQGNVQARTEGGVDPKKLATEQDRIASRTGNLADQIKETEEGGEQEGGEQEGSEAGEQSPGDEEEPNESGENGDKPDSKPSDGEPRDDAKTEGDPKEGDKPKEGEGQQNEQDGKPNEGKPKESKPNEGDPSQSNEGEPSEPNESQQGSPSDQQQGSPQQGSQQEQNDQQQQQQDDGNPARKRLEAAQQRMRDAQKKLEEAKQSEALEDEEAARRELEKAKAELERILRQLREEEMERVLAMLEARFQRMLKAQVKIYEATKRLDKIPGESRGRQVDIQASKLSFDETKLVVEADKALLLLREEGSSVAFPETVDMLRGDMQQVADLLSRANVSEFTQGLEEEIIDSLEEMIAALQQAQQDLEEQKQQQQQPQRPMRPGEEPLVDQLAEVRMIRALQMRVNTRTRRYSKRLADVDDPVGQAEDAELRSSLERLSERQQRVHQVTKDIVLGKNK